MEKVIVILGTARDNSNTRKALEEHLPWKSYELVELHRLSIGPYVYNSNKPNDDFLSVAEKMAKSDVIVFATPVYWYAMSGILKTFFDRLTDLISTSKALGRSLKGKKTFLFATGSNDSLPSGFEVPFNKTSEYFEMSYTGAKYVSLKE